MSDEEYEVEKILDKRQRTNGLEYLVKWKNFDDPEDNTWEPADNLADAEVKIKMFEKDLEAKAIVAVKKDAAKRKSTSTPAIAPDKEPKISRKNAGPKLTGFARNLPAEKIIGATNEPGEMFFLIKWKGTEEADLVPAKEANVKIPQVSFRITVSCNFQPLPGSHQVLREQAKLARRGGGG